jgi:hypothetical protein
MGGSGGGTNTIQSATPWEGQQKYITDVYDRASTQVDTPAQFYPNKTYADPVETQLQAEALARQTALGGQSAVTGSMIPALQEQLAGASGLASNPYLAAANEAQLRPIYQGAQGLLTQARRGANTAGQLGGSRQAILEQGVISDYMQRAGDQSAQFYNNAYGQALEAQTRTLATTPQSLAALQIPAQQLSGVGGAEQARIQQAINEQRQRFEFGQQAPGAALGAYSNLVAGSILPGGSSSKTEGPGQSALAPNMVNTLAGTGGYMAGAAMGGTGGVLAGMGAWAGPAVAAGAYLVGSMFD